MLSFTFRVLASNFVLITITAFFGNPAVARDLFASKGGWAQQDWRTIQNPIALPEEHDTTKTNPRTSTTQTSLAPVTTLAPPGSETPPDHWTPERPDPYVCEYLGENACWQPPYGGEGPPYSHDGNWPKRSKTCSVPALHNPQGDDSPAILAAFDECKHDGHIVFENTTYYIGSVMNTTGLKDVDIEVKGTLLWSTNIDYWLKNSLFFGFQNQSSAWHLGGDGIHF